MSEFKPFGKAINKKFTELSQHELFVAGDNTDELWDTYIKAFPAGTNPLYKTKTEHECSCCRNFVKNLGNAVTIIDGKVETIWNVEGLETPYKEVAAALHAYVLEQPIVGVLRKSEPKYGAESTLQQFSDGHVHTWNHFFGTVAEKHFTKDASEVLGNINTTIQVFKRGLDELSLTAVNGVRKLIKDKALYRGEEHEGAIKHFKTLLTTYGKLKTSRAKELFVFENYNNPASRFRNAVIGTLVQDLSAGVDLEQAVKSFESKVAPTNYKRPTALITPRMIEDAVKTIKELGLEDSLQRRFATISDVSVNNILWVDGSVKPKMKDGIEGLLLDAIKPSVDTVPTKTTEITIDDFMSTVLPKAEELRVFVRNSNKNNLVSITTGDNQTSDLFKWKNNFAWSYNGEIADSDLRKNVASRGGRVDGVLRFSHCWNYGKRNTSLMDLHVFMPGNGKTFSSKCNDEYGNEKRVGWNHRQHTATGGVQDVDYTAAAPVGYVPVENITFPTLSKLPEGTYRCAVHNWSLRQPTQGGFKAEVEFEGQVFEYEVDRPLQHKEWVLVAEVTLRAGKFSIEHKIPCSTSSQKVWGINTEQFVKVETVMYSPNYWDDNAVGNKHWFFLLEGCKNPESTRGIYNEFLSSNLDKHRKVFEILGNKTKCPVAEEQLSGVGFSSTRKDSVVVCATIKSSKKFYTVNF